MKDGFLLRWAGAWFAAYLLACPVNAQDIMETMSSVSDMFYGIAAGVASLMLAYSAVRWKTAEGPEEREAAKRGMLAVVLGLCAVVIAASAVSTVYKKNADTNVSATVAKITSTVVRTTTTKRPTTTTTTVYTSTTTSTTTTTMNYLVPENLVKCVKKKGDLFSRASGCGNCDAQKAVFYNDNPGNGGYWYDWMHPTPGPPGDRSCTCSWYPCWCKKSGSAIDQCRTFAELNTFWGCNLLCKPGYTYYDCGGGGHVLC